VRFASSNGDTTKQLQSTSRLSAVPCWGAQRKAKAPVTQATRSGSWLSTANAASLHWAGLERMRNRCLVAGWPKEAG
jgi:hypothetical protein